MLSKQLLFRLAIILFIIAVIGLLIFKVDQMSVNVTKTSIQSRMERLFLITGQSKELNIKYEIADPSVTVLDSGDIAFKSSIMLTSGLDKKWGTMAFATKVALRAKDNSFHLIVPENVILTFRSGSSNKAGFKLWKKNAEPLVTMITKQMNAFLLTKDIFALSGSQLRVQARSITIHKVNKSDNGIQIVLDVDQGMFVIIVYVAMLLAAFIFACGYFFVGGVVGFKDPTKLLFIDPKKIPKKEGR
ncbi:MAG: hypothetical protein Q9M14_02950 [Mariprofundaceae bacterium]|nr:hypothetical protein [Mariprofundaceae bacterium]